MGYSLKISAFVSNTQVDLNLDFAELFGFGLLSRSTRLPWLLNGLLEPFTQLPDWHLTFLVANQLLTFLISQGHSGQNLGVDLDFSLSLMPSSSPSARLCLYLNTRSDLTFHHHCCFHDNGATVSLHLNHFLAPPWSPCFCQCSLLLVLTEKLSQCLAQRNESVDT